MKPYNPEKPLLSLHVPKCAGQSFRWLLQGWYGSRFFIHYFQQHNAPPPRHDWRAGVCIHGHFERSKKLAIEDYYPAADQFVTILRDPLEIAQSNYFFWKRKARQRQIERGVIREGGEQDYRDIDDFFKKRPRSHVLNFLPGDLNPENYQEVLESRFVWIGLAENLDRAVPVLAARLGFSPVPIERINVSPRDEDLSPDLREEFIHNNRFEFEIFRYVREWWQKLEASRSDHGVESC